LSRDKNQFSDALATVASMTQIKDEVNIQPMYIEVKNSYAYIVVV
jgi:hypothetical protein